MDIDGTSFSYALEKYFNYNSPVFKDNTITIYVDTNHSLDEDGFFVNNEGNSAGEGLYTLSLSLKGDLDISKLYEEIKFLKPKSDKIKNATKVDIYIDGALVLKDADTKNIPGVYFPVASTYIGEESLKSSIIPKYVRGYDLWKSTFSISDDIMEPHNNRNELTDEKLIAGKQVLKTNFIKFKALTGEYQFKLIWKDDNSIVHGQSDVSIKVVKQLEIPFAYHR